MPELPEVETVIRSLKSKIIGKTIVDLKIFLNKFLKDGLTPIEFIEDIKGRKIEDISRIGKNIIFHLQDKVLISHLRMTGKWFVYSPQNFLSSPHNLAEFKLDDLSILVFNDTRKFGTFHYQNSNEYLSINPIKKVGPEPLDKKVVTGKYLMEKMKKSNRHIKTILLDQTIVSGIGNIYADEILFAAKINPLKLASQLSLEEYELIAKYSYEILTKAIEYGGSTIDSYLSEIGVKGRYQDYLMAHSRKNFKCNNCGTEIVKISVNGRGTYFCPICQTN